MAHHISQFFAFAHLPEPLRSMSALFSAAHDELVADPVNGHATITLLKGELLSDLPNNPETFACFYKLDFARSVGADLAGQYANADPVDRERALDPALRALLEAKDCAVRALLAKDVG
jgi:hypothetical protein